MSKKKDLPLAKQKIILQFWEAGLTKSDISKKLDIPWKSAHYYIKKYKTLANFISQQIIIPEKEIIQLYKQSLSVAHVMKTFNISRSIVNKILLKNSIKILSVGDSKIKRSSLGAELNYFNSITPHAAYVLGVIWGDGCIHHNERTHKYYLNVTCEDKDILESVKIYFDNKCIIKPIKNTNAYKINIWSKTLTTLLYDKYGLRGAKAHNLPWLDLTDQQFKYFLSGLHSADGCNENHIRRKNKVVINKGFRWSYTSVCYDFITKIQNRIKLILPDIKITLHKRIHKNNNISYSLRVIGKMAVKLCNWMYSNTSKLTKCYRKYQIFLPWKSHKFHH